MVGAGIYVLVGAAAGQAGIWAPLSFLLGRRRRRALALYSSFRHASPRRRAIPPMSSSDSAALLAVLIGAVNITAGTVAAAAVLRGGRAISPRWCRSRRNRPSSSPASC